LLKAGFVENLVDLSGEGQVDFGDEAGEFLLDEEQVGGCAGWGTEEVQDEFCGAGWERPRLFRGLSGGLMCICDGALEESFEERGCGYGPDVKSFTGGVRGRIWKGSRLHGRILCEQKMRHRGLRASPRCG